MLLCKSVSKKQETIIKQRFRKTFKMQKTSKLKTETFFLLKETFILSKIYRIVNHSVNMGVVET